MKNAIALAAVGLTLIACAVGPERATDDGSSEADLTSIPLAASEIHVGLEWSQYAEASYGAIRQSSSRGMIAFFFEGGPGDTPQLDVVSPIDAQLGYWLLDEGFNSLPLTDVSQRMGYADDHVSPNEMTTSFRATLTRPGTYYLALLDRTPRPAAEQASLSKSLGVRLGGQHPVTGRKSVGEYCRPGDTAYEDRCSYGTSCGSDGCYGNVCSVSVGPGAACHADVECAGVYRCVQGRCAIDPAHPRGRCNAGPSGPSGSSPAPACTPRGGSCELTQASGFRTRPTCCPGLTCLEDRQVTTQHVWTCL